MSPNEKDIRRATLAIARVKVEWGERGPLELYRRMAIAVLRSADEPEARAALTRKVMR